MSSIRSAGGVIDAVNTHTHLRPARANITSRKNGNNVNIKLATAALGAALVLAGSPAFAAEVQSAPAQVSSVQVSTQSYAAESQYLRPAIPGSNGDFED